MKRFIAKHLSSILSVTALTVVSAASWVMINQPKVPQELLKK